MTREVDVFLPGILPSTWLSPNRGERKVGRVPALISEAKGKLRADVCNALLGDDRVRAVKEPFPQAHLFLTLYWCRARRGGPASVKKYRPMDAGNAAYALKAAIDGVKDAGLLVDDDYVHLPLLTTSVQRCDRPEYEGLRIVVKEIE